MVLIGLAAIGIYYRGFSDNELLAYIAFGYILALLGTIPIRFLYRSYRSLGVRFVKSLEARDFKAGGTPEMHGQVEFANKLFPFPVFLVSTFVLTGLALVVWQQQAWFAWFMQLPFPGLVLFQGFARYINWILPWIAPIMLVAIFVTFLGVRPYGYRRSKHDYALALLGVVILTGPFALMWVDTQQPGWAFWFVQLPFMGWVQTQNDPIAVRLYFWVILTLLVTFYVLVFLEHVRPYGNRRRKYDYALTLASTMSLASTPWLGHQLLFESKKLLVYQPLIALALALVTSYSMRQICEPADNPSPAARYMHYWIKTFVEHVVFAGAAFFLPMALPMALVMRYRSVQWMGNCPIVYLRSFSQENAPRVFQKVISDPANKYGVLVALVHESQSASDLTTNYDFLEGSQFSGSCDDDWQAWAADKIEQASAVIIDYSIATEGIRWEVEYALEHSDPSRIVMIVQQGSTIEAPAGVHVIKHEDSRVGFGKVSDEFEKWVCTRVLG